MNKDNGGPAFPVLLTIGHAGKAGPIKKQFEGMPLRDYFAAAALGHVYTAAETNPDKAAEWAYQIADAMLAERNKEKPL